MNQQDKDQQTLIEDLPVDELRQDEVKGGEGTKGSYGVFWKGDRINP